MKLKDALKEYKELERKNPELWEKFKVLDDDESYWRGADSLIICNSKETMQMKMNGPEPYFKDFGSREIPARLEALGFEKISFEKMREALSQKQIDFNRPSWDAFRDHMEERLNSKPSHTIYEIKEKKWTRIGAAWKNGDNTLSIKMNRTPDEKAALQIKSNQKDNVVNFKKTHLPKSYLFTKIDGKTRKIGAAWQNRDGSQNLVIKEKGLNLSESTIYLREIKRGPKRKSSVAVLYKRRERQEKSNELTR